MKLKAFIFFLCAGFTVSVQAEYYETQTSLYLESVIGRHTHLYNKYTASRIQVHISTPVDQKIKGDVVLVPDLFEAPWAYYQAKNSLTQAGFRLITFDYPGTGLSEQLVHFASFDQREVILLLREIRRVTAESLLRPMVVMGHGFGALLASKLVNQVEISRMDETPYMLVLINPTFVTDQTSPADMIKFYEKRAQLIAEDISDKDHFEKLMTQVLADQVKSDIGWSSDILRISYQLPFLFSFQDSLKRPSNYQYGDQFIVKKLIGTEGIRRFCTGSQKDIWSDIAAQMSASAPGMIYANPACQTTRMR